MTEAPLGLYARVLGPAWLELAEPVRLAHSTQTPLRGSLRISYGPARLARALAALLRLPRPGTAADTRLLIETDGGVERWQRTVDGREFNTRQYQTADGELGERVGLLEFRFHLEASNGGLVFRQRDAALMLGSLRLRLPAALAPRIEAHEDPAGAQQTHINVRVSLPALGPLLTYDGTMHVEATRR